jgi:hypothetical protein
VISKKGVLGDTSETAEAIHRLKEEIDKLTLQQTEALKMAVYVGRLLMRQKSMTNADEES